MSPESTAEISLKDMLSDVTRKERRMLLGISVLSIFVARTGLVPTKISVLGLELAKTDQQTFLWAMAFVVSYFIAAFFLYGLPDFIAWRMSYNKVAKVVLGVYFAKFQGGARDIREDSDSYVPEGWVSSWPNRVAHSVSVLRVLFEFILPIVVGGYAIFALVFAIK